MNTHLSNSIASAAAALTLAGAVLAPVASAAHAGQTLKVHDTSAYVDNKGPGRYFIGTIFKGNAFKIDRAARVPHGASKGLWYHGTATVTGEHARDSHGHIRAFKLTGWVPASAFS